MVHKLSFSLPNFFGRVFKTKTYVKGKNMKKYTIILTSVLTALLLSLQAFSQFEKTSVYTEGQFSDVPDKAWYSLDVKQAYELGLVNGTGDNVFSPESTMTAAQGITVASRIHASFNEKTIPETTGKNWYDSYVSYALENGIIEENTFNYYGRDLKRHEMATLFANALPKEYYGKINDISAIPDVDEKEEYADDLLLLYNAGIIMGSDSYGTFHPTDKIKRCEVCAIINRAVYKENRLKGTLEKAPILKEAYFLIDDEALTYNTRGKNHLASSWNYDNRYTLSTDITGNTTNKLIDENENGFSAINRSFDPQKDGVLTFETKIYVGSEKNGVRTYFENSDGKNVFEIYTKEDYFFVKTPSGDTKTDCPAKSGSIYLKTVFDLDGAKAVVFINNKNGGEFDITGFGDFSRLVYSTGEKEKTYFVPETARLYKNFALIENFESGFVPVDWDVNGGENVSYSGNNLFFAVAGKAYKSFKAIDGKFVFEVYAYLPEAADKAVITLGNISIALENSSVNTADLSVKVQTNQWQTIHIEGDTTTGKGTLFVNGKKSGSFNFEKACFDSLLLDVTVNSGEKGVYFDDIKLHNVYDYADYCPEPEKAESEDYTLVMSVCSLWKEGTHSGWDFVSPFDECSPLLGYYDEGNPEAMDWEIKQMAEHGIDAMQFCWFADGKTKADFDKPQKNNHLKYALHDGYYYAKYIDYVDFCILWENAQYTDVTMTLDQFRRFLWDYWVEYYFTHPNYLKVDNKIFFEIYDYKLFVKTFGGVDGCKAIIDFMNEDIKKYGFDGITVLFGSNTGSAYSDIAKMGADGVMPYAYTESSYDPEVLKASYDSNVKASSEYDNVSFVPAIATGRSSLGWEGKRSPLATPDQHAKVLQYAKDALASQKNKSEKWRSEVIYFSTWNEYAEGHWLAPSGLNGYGYADEWRKAFTNAKEEHDDVTPTIKQKERIGRLYNDFRTPIKPLLQVEKTEVGKPEVVLQRYDFSNEADKDNFTFNQHFASVITDAQNGVLLCETKASDCIMWTADNLGINTKDIAMIHFRIRTSKADSGNIFFITNEKTGYSASKSYSFTTPANEYTDIYISTETNKDWAGTLKQIRFDFVEGICSFEVDFIEYLSYSESQKGKTIFVGGIELSNLQNSYITSEDDEIYIAADPASGIFSALNLYHEWNRFTGKLIIKSSKTKEFIFTKGSDKAFADGKEISLKKAFYLYDGLPVIPLKTLLDNGTNIKYTENATSVNIETQTKDYTDIISSRKKGVWEFDVPGDSEKWSANNGTLTVWNGRLELQPSFTEWSTTGYDAFIMTEGLNLDASKCVAVKVRMKYEYLGNAHGKKEDGGLTLYFATNNSKSFDEDKTLRTSLKDGIDDGNGYKIYTFDATLNDRWTDTVTKLRFDPTNNNGIYAIDSITIVSGENTVAKESVYSLNSENKRKLVYEVTFDKADDKSLFNLVFIGNSSVSDGVLSVTANNSDPQITFKELPQVLKNASNCDTMVVRMKIDSEKTPYSTCFFMTSDMNGYKADRSAEVNVSKLSKEDDDYYTVEYDLSKNKFWTGEIKGIRLDPAEIECTYHIDSISFYTSKDTVNISPLPEKPKGELIYEVSFDSEEDKGLFNLVYISDAKVNGSVLSFTAKSSDPQLTFTQVPDALKDSSAYNTVVVRMKADSDKKAVSSVFFMKDDMKGFKADHNSERNVSLITPDADGFYTVEFNLSDNSNWSGTVTGMRIDPAEIECTYHIDSISFYKK